MSRILITGASGFVGRALVPVLAPRHALVLAGGRRGVAFLPPGGEHRAIGTIGPDTDWHQALDGVDTVIHLAAHVHQPDRGGDPGAFHRVNALGTQRLAEAARAAGIRRFVFLSTVKVHGETSGDKAFREDDAPHPQGPYAQSKWAAEQGLAEIAGDGCASPGLAVVILRPPLVYGPGAAANVRALARLCRLGLPLPFGAIDNRRSLIFLGNLVAAIAGVVAAPPGTGCRTYLLRDGEDLSTAALVRRLGAALGRPPVLVPVPPSWLELGLRIIGRGAPAERLLRSLAVDDSRFRRDFAWEPPYTVDKGLAATAAAFR